jgi:CheY-like chemotaxis protein
LRSCFGRVMSACKIILIVEDDHDIRVLLRDLLESDGFDVLTATNGKEAFDILRTAEKPALIFLDILMPIMDGHEFLKLIRADTFLASIPVVVTSAIAHPEGIEGARSFSRKPFDLGQILKVAREYCS